MTAQAHAVVDAGLELDPDMGAALALFADPNRTGRRLRTPAPVITEAQVQGAVIEYLMLLEWYVCHVPGGAEDEAEQGRQIAAGYMPGFPDLYCEPPDPSRPPVLIECKRPGRQPTPKQRLCHAELRERGREVWVIDDPAQLWEEYGVWPTPEAASALRERLGWLLSQELFGNRP